ncbi:FUSC family protein [Rathayibacter sp. KR2-224]|uniref:FUSC family protein n=1 Tax=Rathayibacter sp. KR2-224 TaxID=3400913 RepID=UPI003C0856D2
MTFRARPDFGGWLKRHDPGFGVLRRAARTAILVPALFAFGFFVVRNSDFAMFCAFGSFAMLLFVGFGGTMRERLQAQASLAVTGAVLVCLGTLLASPAWLGSASMAIVAFVVLFLGTVSDVLASASTSLLLSFILPVMLPGGISTLVPRLAGWGTASVVAFAAVALLWPAPARMPLRTSAAAACRALGARLRADADHILAGRDAASAEKRDADAARADAALTALRDLFLSSPTRPTSLNAPARTVVRLVDELSWLQVVVAQSALVPRLVSPQAAEFYLDVCRVKTASADVLECGADILMRSAAPSEQLRIALARLTDARSASAESALKWLPPLTGRLPGDSEAVDAGAAWQNEAAGADGRASGRTAAVESFVSALDPGFRTQELGYAVGQVGRNITLTAEAERRGWWDKALGRQPGDLIGSFSAGVERAGAQLEWHSVWLHNSIRGAIALALAVLLADLAGVQHSFWVVLGTLAVLRSNALSTGRNIVRSVVGTAVGVALGGVLLALIGTNTVALWILLPFAVLAAGVAPTVISFAAGQAAFTLTLVLLFNIIEPTGWTVGLYRIEDVALGSLVSLAVGLLFWPRGAAAALRTALAEAYAELADYLSGAVGFGVNRWDDSQDSHPAPLREARRAAAAARRLDDAFRTYLSEPSGHRVPLEQAAAAVAGVAGIRVVCDALVDMWNSEDASGRLASKAEHVRAASALEASCAVLAIWCRRFGKRLVERAELPGAPVPDEALTGELVDSLRSDLAHDGGGSAGTAVRLVWTGDYLDAVRRIEARIVAAGPDTAG